jgi:hypothetical protein
MCFINIFDGVLSNIRGINLGLLFRSWLLERLVTVLVQLISLDLDGTQS